MRSLYGVPLPHRASRYHFENVRRLRESGDLSVITATMGVRAAVLSGQPGRCAAASGASTSTTVAVKSPCVDALAAQLTHKAAAATLPKPSPVEQSPVDPAGQSSSTSTKGQSKSYKKESPRRENLLRASGARCSSPPRQQRDQRRRSPERRSSLRHASPEREASRRQRSPRHGIVDRIKEEFENFLRKYK